MWQSRYDLRGQAYAQKLHAECMVLVGNLDMALEMLKVVAGLATRANHIYIQGEVERLCGEIWTHKLPLGELKPRWSLSQGHFLKVSPTTPPSAVSAVSMSMDCRSKD
jgi:hypothetical protein